MDIAGAKALKERLGAKAAERAASPRVEVHEDAPPVYHWTGVVRQPDSQADRDDTPADRQVPKFFWLRLGTNSR
jgi:hypothetical protein